MTKLKNPTSNWDLIVVSFLVIIGTIIYLVARSDPEVLESVNSLVTAIWNRLCNVANDFNAFIQSLMPQTP
jgi:hypothetical protein